MADNLAAGGAIQADQDSLLSPKYLAQHEEQMRGVDFKQDVASLKEAISVLEKKKEDLERDIAYLTEEKEELEQENQRLRREYELVAAKYAVRIEKSKAHHVALVEKIREAHQALQELVEYLKR